MCRDVRNVCLKNLEHGCSLNVITFLRGGEKDKKKGRKRDEIKIK